MRVSGKLVSQLFEAAAARGIPREAIVSGVSPSTAARIANLGAMIEWDSLAELFEKLWAFVDHDVTRMRSVGGALVHAPSYLVLRRLAHSVVSVRALYEAGHRWAAPAAFPHLSLEMRPASGRRIGFLATIPTPHAPSEGFFRLFEGVLIELPTLLGLPRAVIVTSELTERSLDVVVELPRSSTLVGRLRHAYRAAVYPNDAVDFLESQRAEIASGLQAVRRGATEIQEVFDNLPVLVVIHRNGAIVWKNRAFTRTLGYEGHDDLVGRSLFDVVEPSGREMIRARLLAPVEELPELAETRLLARDGRIVVAEVFPTQLVTFEGEPARMIVGRDATDRVKLQEQLLISARMASIGMLAAGVAHEVNNPLAYVLNNVEIAMKQLGPLGDGARQARDALGVALEGVDRIRTIVRDLLALSRIDESALGPVDVTAVVESTLALARKEITERASLSYDALPVPLARGTVARVGQVLLNLLSNALESMAEGARDTNTLRVVLRPSNGSGAVIEITDNGVGIPPEHVPRIFDPFFTTKAPGHGTGLGLAISQRLVAEMGGELSFTPAEPRGSTFRLTLPGADAEVRTSRDAPPPAL
jgi:PAS domain S-box-containing protein